MFKIVLVATLVYSGLPATATLVTPEEKWYDTKAVCQTELSKSVVPWVADQNFTDIKFFECVPADDAGPWGHPHTHSGEEE